MALRPIAQESSVVLEWTWQVEWIGGTCHGGSVKRGGQEVRCECREERL